MARYLTTPKMPELSNMVDEAEPETYYENYNTVVLKPNAPAVSTNKTAVAVEEGLYTVATTDDATPSSLMLLNANTSTFAPYTTTLPSLASASKPPKNFTITIPIIVRLPVEAFYRNFPTDASGRGRRVITTNLTYDVTVELPETRIPSDDAPLPTSYARPDNPWSSTTTQYQPTVTDEPESLPRSGVGHDKEAPDAPPSGEQPDMNLPGGDIPETTPLSDEQLGMNASGEEVIGHNWIKFHDEEQLHVSPSDNPAQMRTMRERHAPRDSRWAALRSILHNIGENVGEKLKGSEGYKGNKLKKENKPKK